MSELRYPNESKVYRDARGSLLKDEQELVDKVKSVAERRRNLSPGITGNPNRLITAGTDWRFLNELKKELKA